VPKKSKEINPFDGGWNNFANARDIEENESAVLVNLSSLKKGQLYINKNWKTVTLNTGSNYLEDQRIVSYRGLFVFKRDFNTAGTPVEGETTIYLVSINQNSNVSKLVMLTDLNQNSAVTDIFSFANTSGSPAILPCFVESGGNVRISDGSFSTKTYFYGAMRKYKLDGNGINFGINEKNHILPPVDGNVYTGTMNESASTTAGTLNLNILQIKSYQNDQVTYTGSGDTQPTEISGSYANPNILGTSANNANSSSFNSNNDTDAMQGGFVNQMRKRASDNNWSDTYLYGPGDTSANAYFCAVASYNTSSHPETNQSSINFVTGNQTFNFIDKSLLVPIWVSAETYSRLETTAFKIHIGNNNTNYYSFHILSSLITSAETWITIECIYGNHDETSGSAVNPNSFKFIEVEIFNSSETNWDVNAANALWGFNYAIGAMTVGTPNQGQWTGNYLFYYNWIYDRTQHSETFKFGNQGSDGLTTTGDILEFMPYMKDGGTAGQYQRSNNAGGNELTARITGANIFFSEIDESDVDIDKDKKFLMELDFDSGARSSLFDVYTLWNTSTTTAGYKLVNSISVKSPIVIDSFSTVAGYSEGDKLNTLDFSTGIMLNNRMYVGNVKTFQTSAKSLKYPDRIYKSLPNQPDVFTKNNYLEVAPNDGDAITALSSYGDFLMEFKANDMHLINVTQDIEYLEEGYRFAGVWSEHALCRTRKGIAWVNRNGLYFFDGKEVINLLAKKMSRETWYADVGAYPLIVYAPLEDQVHVIANTTHESLVYSFVNESFEKYTGGNTTDSISGNVMSDNTAYTNAIIEPDANLTLIESANNGNSGSTNITRWSVVGDANNYISLESKDHDLDDPARQKSLKKVYITYKINSTTVPTIQYKKDNGTARSFDTAFTNTSGSWNTIGIKPSTSSEANNGFSFQILIYGETHSSFAINDINMIYREKSVK
tara:strand:+ start:4175 stop:7012 length:2838 start_codon:yes stop_codon:yes gene_type:complete